MGLTIAQKIIKNHLISGEMKVGEEIALRIDQTLTQDATGTMAYLELEAMKTSKVKTELSVSYVDHNMMQNGPENRNDHLYLQTVAAEKGVVFSPPGNGICHQLHLEHLGHHRDHRHNKKHPESQLFSRESLFLCNQVIDHRCICLRMVQT